MLHRTIAVLPLLLLACGPSPTPTPSEKPPAKPEPIPTQPDQPAQPEDAPVELAPIAPPGEHPFSVLDMLEVDRVGSPALSPEGKRVAYVLRETDMQANKLRSSLWLVGVEGQPPVELDAHPKGASSPSWSASGDSLYFMSSRSGSAQVWRLAIDPTGKPGALEQVTSLPVGVGGYALSGTTLVVSAELFPDCDTLACTAARLKASEDDPASGQVYDRMFVRHWDTWTDGRRSMLLALELAGPGQPPVEDARILTRTLDADAPSKPFGGFEELTFTPDGKGLVFTARDAGGGPGEPWSTNFDLFHVPLDGSQPPERLTDNPAWDTHPRFSPDGSTLAWLAMDRPGYEADRRDLVLARWTGSGIEGELRERTLRVDGPSRRSAGERGPLDDRSIDDYEFAPSGEQIWAVAQHLGRTLVFSLPVSEGLAKPAIEHGSAAGLQVGAERLVFVHHDLRHAPELWTMPLGEGAPAGPASALTHHNDELLARTKLGEPTPFEFEGAAGELVRGWVVAPVDLDPTRKYPIALLIHGGPQGSFGDQFHFRWNPQAYAGAGYAVVMIDFHGSTGYGQAFTDSIRTDWGGKPLEDLRRGMAHALATFPWLDGTRACALGASYGGFMINWIAGQWPEGFRCLVNHDGIFDTRSMYYSTEELWFPEWEFGAPEFADPQAHARFNPALHVDRWQTPMLVIHGSLDYRVPVEQGLATFTALQRRGVPSRLLHFPDENHWVLAPANSKQWHDEVLRWLGEHLSVPAGVD